MPDIAATFGGNHPEIESTTGSLSVKISNPVTRSTMLFAVFAVILLHIFWSWVFARYVHADAQYRTLRPEYYDVQVVTNAEYLDFIESGAYQDHRLWHMDGWTWVNAESVRSPLYWHAIESQWHEYRLSGFAPLDLAAPVTHVNYYEASAFALWAGASLPTEGLWEHASDQLEWGKRWEWSNSAYLPYPGYRIPPGAVGEYNGKFMVNQMVLKGASVATPEGHSRPSYRNFFYPDQRWQYTGIRLCR